MELEKRTSAKSYSNCKFIKIYPDINNFLNDKSVAVVNTAINSVSYILLPELYPIIN